MARRAGALFGIVVLIALVVVLVWNVYRHHELMHETDESAVVRLDAGRTSAVVIFALASR